MMKIKRIEFLINVGNETLIYVLVRRGIVSIDGITTTKYFIHINERFVIFLENSDHQ